MVGPPGTVQNIVVPARTHWHWNDAGLDLGSAWRTGLTPTGWSVANGPFGYGEPYLQTTVSYGSDPNRKHPTTYFLRGFPVGSNVRALYLRVMYDDGFVFYLNGKEGGRAHMPSGTISYGTYATGHEASNRYVTFDISSQIPNLRGGDWNWLAIEVHQASASSSDLVFDAELIAWDDFDIGHTSEGIPRESFWKFWDRGGDLGTAWRAPGYDDDEWSAARAVLGYGEPYVDSTINNGGITSYYRAEFSHEGVATGITCEALYDDGLVAYLNGTEILRRSMPSGTITASTLASGHETGRYEPFDCSHAVDLLVPGINVLAVEVHQVSASSSDLTFDFGLEVHGRWTPVESGFDMELTSVWMIDEQKGFAVGTYGGVLRTNDGGMTWSPVDVGVSRHWYAVEFAPDGLTGWIVGSDATRVFTRDGGVTWGTTDHGSGFNLTGVSLPDAQHGRMSSDTRIAFASDNGGDNTGTYGVVFTHARFDDISFVDPATGWTVGLVAVDGDSWAAIYRSDDSAQTWSQQWISGQHFYQLFDVEIVDRDTVWAVGHSSLSGAGEKKLVTRDGGASWTETAETSNGSGIYGLDFVDGQRAWGVGFHGGVITTSDGGATWQVENAITDDGPHLYDVHAFPSGHAVAVGTGGTIWVRTP